MNSPLPSSNLPHSAAKLEEQLEEFLDPVLTSRRTATTLARNLEALERDSQDFVMHWVAVIARSNAEMAYQFAAIVPEALTTMDTEGIESWIIQAMDTYDKSGLYPGVAALKDLHKFEQRIKEKNLSVSFEEVSHVLELFVCGLSGRQLKLETSTDAYTDTETIYLPAYISLFPCKEDNFKVYKATLTHLWAQTRFGTFRKNLIDALSNYASQPKALAWLNTLEHIRLCACITRALPGIANDMKAFHSEPFRLIQSQCQKLLDVDAAVEDSLNLVANFYPKEPPEPSCCMGILIPAQVEAVRNARMLKDKEAFRVALAHLVEEKKQKSEDLLQENSEAAHKFTLERAEISDTGEMLPYDLFLDGQPISPPDGVTSVMESIVQDLGEIPNDYLVPAGEGTYRKASARDDKASDVWKGVYHEEGASLYNEWDYRRKHYRKNWCVLRELNVHPQNVDFVDAALIKYRGELIQLKRTFEMLRGEDRLFKKQRYGDDIDLDAVVEAYADMRCGMELPDRLLIRRHKSERNMAVMFMVDMSGSTKGWINDAEREALVLLCEAVELLGDQYAIYGFSGMTRKRCELYRVKRFDEPYSDIVKQRIAGITPQDYTRMGVAIRHLTSLLNQVDARTKLLITLSDGKPDDYSDGYRGEYGIEDTRQALLETKRNGIHPFCITIDREAKDYLPRMYGAVNYTVIDDVARLPLKVADIYRRLTT